MLDPRPIWTFASKKSLTQWYEHVQLLPNHAVGQWFCVDRQSGELIWQQAMVRPNTICGVDAGVIVASEMRSDGPWTASFGCYGISLKNGQLLWTAHRSGLMGRITRLLDFVPGFTNEFRDAPRYVQDGEVVFPNGRVLDVQTGRLVRWLDDAVGLSHEMPVSIGSRFYRSGSEEHHPRIAIGNGLFLRHATDKPGWQRGNLRIAAETDAGKNIWLFTSDQSGRHIDGNFYSYRLVPPFLYLVLSDECPFKPNPMKKHYVLPNPTRWHFVTVDLFTGTVMQDFSLDDKSLEGCRIEDIDERGVLIGKSNQNLAYYQRAKSE